MIGSPKPFEQFMATLVGDQEIREFPVLVKKGGSMGIKMEEEEKVFEANKRVILDPQDACDLIFTLRFIIAIQIYQCHIGAGAATAQP
jgi:hypothetical protein